MIKSDISPFDEGHHAGEGADEVDEMVALKPCPFCGGHEIAIEKVLDLRRPSELIQTLQLTCMTPSCYVHLAKRFTPDERTKAERDLTTRWNRRVENHAAATAQAGGEG
jgi:hypothetical protein